MLASPAGFICLLLSVPIVAWDLTEWRVPDWLTIGGAAVVAAVRLLAERAALPAVLEGACIAAGLFYGLWYLTAGGIGRGDAKYALQIGVALPAVHLLVACVVGYVAACTAALLLRNADALPFSPFLFIGLLWANTLSQLGIS